MSYRSSALLHEFFPPGFPALSSLPLFFGGTTGTLAKKPPKAAPLLALACPTRGGALALLAGTRWDTSPRVRRPALSRESMAGALACPGAGIFGAKFAPPAAIPMRWLVPLIAFLMCLLCVIERLQ